jgi:hypothetical protein
MYSIMRSAMAVLAGTGLSVDFALKGWLAAATVMLLIALWQVRTIWVRLH